ncbi:MAG: nucleotidyl transferase AbiEii/AbiGii toxin family protein, partial [Ignavibacteria bacterium]|nr:nucleotidyl transferase AbiEii/AbiGii toxin family protein [Ignavibacteria bacterium]
MNEIYRKQVALLIRIMPLVHKINDFAVHGGTAINLFVKNMPRLSVDIDLTYLPLKNRNESLQEINNNLLTLKQHIEKAIPGIRVIHKPTVWKLLCTKGDAMVKIEVNGTKRGIIGEVEERELCEKAQKEFKMSCTARIVPVSLLYGGKIAAALSRQHPRDFFDYKYMEVTSFAEVKDGLIFYLLGSDKPLIESLQPNLVDQKHSLTNQFQGMSDIPFDYTDFESIRKVLIENVNQNLTVTDREFLISFERGSPEWDKCCAGDLSSYPSIQWKLKNILTL